MLSSLKQLCTPRSSVFDSQRRDMEQTGDIRAGKFKQDGVERFFFQRRKAGVERRLGVEFNGADLAQQFSHGAHKLRVISNE